MTANVGAIDRILRIVVGLILIAMVFVGPQTSWGWIGVIPLLTALIGFCPAYRLIGFEHLLDKEVIFHESMKKASRATGRRNDQRHQPRR